ncbi:GNAT family N-acetyltransferase [Kribbella deserti]|uniref:GNAT family N-acetyltransferase n=1 Tax=Kribbella deserti TaxID=1926257 RepID=A0ABV6QZK0_9ACTN
MDVDEVVRAWVFGWAVSRGTAPPVPVDEGWRVEPREFLMSKDLAAVPEPRHESYDVKVTEDGTSLVKVVAVTGQGEPAARAQGAFAQGVMTVDQVETEPARRRRGLGRLVMTTLEYAAAERGVRRAALVATEDGRALYHSLGWTVGSPITATVRR